MKAGKKRLKLFAALFAALILGMAFAFTLAGYDASPEAKAAMAQGTTRGRVTAFEPEQICAGLIFYPGALVDHAAYAPLMQALCARGVLCLLVEMPLDLAIFDVDAAEGLRMDYPQVERWMIGGHSLGGAMAAEHASEHAKQYDALVLLGAYSQADLSETALSVLSVYGSKDFVLNGKKYAASLVNYPKAFREFVIEGGCHAYFGDYGAQKGDGQPLISREMQIGMTADAICALAAQL